MSDALRPQDAPSAWRQAMPALAFSLVWILFWYRDTVMGMVGIWARSDTFAHGFIVIPISAWLIWRQRARLAKLAPQPSLVFLPLLVGAGIAWLLGQLAAVNALAQFALVFLAVFAVPALLGKQLARRLAFPLLFVLFAVPFGEFVMPQLMQWTADFTVFGLRLSGVPVYREGLDFVIPSGNWSVAEACSGVRYLMASVMVGSLFAYLNYVSLKRRLIFVGISILVPIFANWVRAYMIVMLGHLSGNRLAVGVDHLIYGWIFFGVVIMLMFLIGARWNEEPLPDSPAPMPAAMTPAPTGAAFWAAAGLVAALTLLPLAATWLIARSDAADTPRLDLAADSLQGGWHPTGSDIDEWHPFFSNPSAEFKAAYDADGRSVGLYIGYYRNQDFSRKLVSSTNALVSGEDKYWSQVSRGTQPIDFAGQPVTARRAELRAGALLGQEGERRLVVWQVYWINGRLTASDHLAKAYTLWSRLTGQGDDSAAIIVYAPARQAGGGDAAIEAFLQANAGIIDATLRDTRGRR